MKHQRGEAVLAVLVIISALRLGWSMTAKPVGRWIAVAQGASIVRMDTRTGTMERCYLVGATLTCQPMETQ